MRFWNDEEYQGAADEIISATLEEPTETSEGVEAQANETLNWAIQKIEEANLFKHLVKQPVFSEGSAEPSILASVNEKIRRFAIEQLEELLGGAKKQEKEVVQVKLPFSENEVFALKTLAGAVLKKTNLEEPAAPEERVPAINNMTVYKEKTIQTAKVQTQPTPKTSIPQKAQAKAAPPKAKKAGENETDEERIQRLKTAKKVPRSPIAPIAPPVNDSWAISSAHGQSQALAAKGEGSGFLSSLVNNAIAAPVAATPTGSGLHFDPDDKQ
jgi:hypothetical protein